MECLHLLILLWTSLSETDGLSTAREIMGWVGGSIVIPCEYDLRYRDHVKYTCRGFYADDCKILAETESPPKAEDRIVIRDDKTRGVFTFTVKNLTKKDVDYYSCGIKKEYRDERFRLYLKVDTGNYGLSINGDSNMFDAQDGGSVTVSCKYFHRVKVKFWCRGRDWESCQRLETSESNSSLIDRVVIRDDSQRQVFSLTMVRLERSDSGWYWCAVEKTEGFLKFPLFIKVNGADVSEPPKRKTFPFSSINTPTSLRPTTERTSNTDHPKGSQTKMALVVLSIIFIVFLLVAVIVTVKKNKRGGRKSSAGLERRQELSERSAMEQSSEILYAKVCMQKSTKRKEKAPADPEVIYSEIIVQETTDNQQ